MLGHVGALLAGALPQLERLKLHGAAELDLQHPGLAELELGCADDAGGGRAARRAAGAGRSARRARPPGVAGVAPARAAIDAHLNRAVAALVATNLLAGLDELTLHGDLTRDGVASLATARLRRVDVRGCPQLAPADLAPLERVATAVVHAAGPQRAGPRAGHRVAGPPPAAARLGIGRVVAETDAGLEVEFEHAGPKLVRNVELLEQLG